jgi:hypothetical protein
MWGGDGVVFPQALRAAPEAAREGSTPHNGQYHNEHGHLVHAVKAWLHQLVGGLQPAAQLPPPAPLVEPWAAARHAPLHHRNAGLPAQAQQQGPRGHPAERSQSAAGAAGQPATPPVAAASHAAPPAPSGGNGARRSKPRLFQRGTCQADGCTIDLTAHSYYSNRNHICPSHLKADSFVKLVSPAGPKRHLRLLPSELGQAYRYACIGLERMARPSMGFLLANAGPCLQLSILCSMHTQPA